MSKQRESKLDQHAATLLDLDAQRQTLEEMLAWLRAEGVACSASTLSRWLESQRSRQLQEKLLARIATGAEQCAAVEKQFGSNPAPELETLIKLQRVLILNLSTQANADPAMLELIGNSFRAVLESEKLKLKREELGLAKDRFQVEACEFFLRWFNDRRAQEIAASTMSNADKIAALRKTYFKDVDALQQSGKVVLPE